MKGKILDLVNNQFYRSSLLMTTGSFVSNLLNYVFNFLCARALGPSGFGEITSLFSYLTILTIPIVIPSTLIIQKISAKNHRQIEYAYALEHWLVIKSKRWWPIFALFILFIPLFPKITNLSPLVSYALIPLLFLSLVGAFYIAALQGLKLFKNLLSVGLISTIIKLSGAIMVSIGLGGLNSVLSMLVFSSIYSFIYSKKIFTNQVKSITDDKLQIYEKTLTSIFSNKQFIVTTISLLSIMLLNNIDIVFVKKFFAAADAGLYSSWSLLAKIIFYVIGPIFSVSFVFFSNNNENNHFKTLKASFIILCSVSLVGYCLYTFTPDLVVKIFFGNKFIAILPYLKDASIFGVCYAVIFLMNNFFIATENVAALALAAFMPFYAIGLLLLEKRLAVMIRFNIFFSFTVMMVYLLLFALNYRKVKIKPLSYTS